MNTQLTKQQNKPKEEQALCRGRLPGQKEKKTEYTFSGVRGRNAHSRVLPMCLLQKNLLWEIFPPVFKN